MVAFQSGNVGFAVALTRFGIANVVLRSLIVALTRLAIGVSVKFRLALVAIREIFESVRAFVTLIPDHVRFARTFSVFVTRVVRGSLGMALTSLNQNYGHFDA